MNNYFTLNNRIAFYTPSTMQGSKKITQKEFIARSENIARLFSQMFGGASVENVNGYYTLETGELVNESIKKVTAFTDTAGLKKNKKVLFYIASKLCKAWSQETIGLEINNKFYLVDSSKVSIDNSDIIKNLFKNEVIK